jgi:hypothetical protein
MNMRIKSIFLDKFPAADKNRYLIRFACLLLAAAGSAVAWAEPVVFLDQDEFVNALSVLGFSAIHEGFENDSVWGSVRSTISTGRFTASSITSKGLTWSANNPDSEITTGHGPARQGDWGFYSLPHGSYGNTVPRSICFVPGACGDGWHARAVEGELVAMGGWIDTNTPFAKLGLYLGEHPQNKVKFGETCDPPDSENCFSNSVITNALKFWGVIDTQGFSAVEFRELEGKLEFDGGDIKFIFADDFWFAFRNTDRISRDGFE